MGFFCLSHGIGRKQKKNGLGDGYGWNSTVFCTVEQFWGEQMLESARQIRKTDAIQKIAAYILELNPQAEPKQMNKLIQA